MANICSPAETELEKLFVTLCKMSVVMKCEQ